MKLSNIVKAISFATLALSVPVSAAIEVDFANKNLLQSQKIGSVFKRERDAARLGGAQPHHDIAYLATDTDALVEAAHAGGNTAKFVTMAKAGIILAADAWIDTLLVANNAFLDAAVARLDNGGAVGTPATVGRNDFKAALAAIINAVASATPAPANKRLTTLTATRALIVGEIDTAVDAWIDTLIGAANMLNAAVAVGGGGQPATIGRDDFKAALSNIITAY